MSSCEGLQICGPFLASMDKSTPLEVKIMPRASYNLHVEEGHVEDGAAWVALGTDLPVGMRTSSPSLIFSGSFAATWKRSRTFRVACTTERKILCNPWAPFLGGTFVSCSTMFSSSFAQSSFTVVIPHSSSSLSSRLSTHCAPAGERELKGGSLKGGSLKGGSGGRWRCHGRNGVIG